MIDSIRYTGIYQAEKYLNSIDDEEVKRIALISVREPTCRMDFPYEKTSKHLILTFDDAIANPTDALGIGLIFVDFVLFDENMANSILSFADELYNSENHYDLLIHCHAGISRSAAIQMALSQKYDRIYDHDYKLHNKLVYKTLMKTHLQKVIDEL
jgi:predicted protein tyrosine phosphatase